MGAEYKDLIKIKEVIDTDVGYYHCGEIECCYNDEELKKFFKSYGIKGRDELMNSITHLIHNIEASFRSLPENIRFPDIGTTKAMTNENCAGNIKMPADTTE